MTVEVVEITGGVYNNLMPIQKKLDAHIYKYITHYSTHFCMGLNNLLGARNF
jgi:hypothetical protein